MIEEAITAGILANNVEAYVRGYSLGKQGKNSPLNGINWEAGVNRLLLLAMSGKIFLDNKTQIMDYATNLVDDRDYLVILLGIAGLYLCITALNEACDYVPGGLALNGWFEGRGK